MKKLMILSLALIGFLCVGCGQQAEFEFRFDVTSDVFDPKTNVTFVMPSSFVTNLVVDVPDSVKMFKLSKAFNANDTTEIDSYEKVARKVHFAATINPPTENVVKMEDFLDDYMEKVVIPSIKTSDQTLYKFHIKGFVREKLTGITIGVDKTITNR